MSIPAFLLHTTTPYSLPNHFSLARSPPRHRSTAPLARRRPRATTVVVYLAASIDDGDDSSRDEASTRKSEEASLEETFDAIDDVVMDRQPGEGESNAGLQVSVCFQTEDTTEPTLLVRVEHLASLLSWSSMWYFSLCGALGEALTQLADFRRIVHTHALAFSAKAEGNTKMCVSRLL